MYWAFPAAQVSTEIFLLLWLAFQVRILLAEKTGIWKWLRIFTVFALLGAMMSWLSLSGAPHGFSYSTPALYTVRSDVLKICFFAFFICWLPLQIRIFYLDKSVMWRVIGFLKLITLGILTAKSFALPACLDCVYSYSTPYYIWSSTCSFFTISTAIQLRMIRNEKSKAWISMGIVKVCASTIIAIYVFLTMFFPDMNAPHAVSQKIF